MISDAYWQPLNFELPRNNASDIPWHRWIDTGLDSPNDIVTWQTAPQVCDFNHKADAHSVAVL